MLIASKEKIRGEWGKTEKEILCRMLYIRESVTVCERIPTGRNLSYPLGPMIKLCNFHKVSSSLFVAKSVTTMD